MRCVADHYLIGVSCVVGDTAAEASQMKSRVKSSDVWYVPEELACEAQHCPDLGCDVRLERAQVAEDAVVPEHSDWTSDLHQQMTGAAVKYRRAAMVSREGSLVAAGVAGDPVLGPLRPPTVGQRQELWMWAIHFRPPGVVA